MKLKKLSFKNFKSYSNVMTEIDFGDTSSLNLIVGENGTGKTSIAECATYLLYGKIENFNASDIPNRINKAFYGKIEVDCDGHQIVIERGLNPSLFNVIIDGNQVDTAGKLNVQSNLEDVYFKIPYSVFHNILVLEVGEVKSLLSMSVGDKRNIIDKICGFTRYNVYKEFAKSDMRSLDEKISSNDTELRTMNMTLLNYEQKIEEIRSNSTSQTEIDELTRMVNEAKEQKSKYDEQLSKLREAGDRIRNGGYKSSSDFNILKSRVQDLDRKIAFIDKGRCPTCGSSLETDEFRKERAGYVEQKEECLKQMEQIKTIITDVQTKLNTLDAKSREIQQKSGQVRLLDLQSDLKYKINMKERDCAPIEALKTNLSKDMERLTDERRKLDEDKKVMDFVVSMFSDGGIKRYISNMYIPIINSLMSEMLKFMNLNYMVTFDGDFNAEILQNGMKVKYGTLSKGEKRRVDFAAVIAFIKFLKLQFGELNLLFLDEIFSNVDVNGVNDMIDILKDLSREMNLNVYLIHHAKLEGVAFDRIMQTKKVDGFSMIEYL